jgi:hypothetical protein
VTYEKFNEIDGLLPGIRIFHNIGVYLGDTVSSRLVKYSDILKHRDSEKKNLRKVKVIKKI